MIPSIAQASQFTHKEVRRVGRASKLDSATRFIRTFEHHRRGTARRESPFIEHLNSKLHRITALISLPIGGELDTARSAEVLRPTEKPQRLNPIPRIDPLVVAKSPTPQFIGRMKQNFACSEPLQRDDG